ncbi:MAG: hypothetical protein HWD61_06300 [Parachlamydiaceae bacterium]|nr:MAG: hypothetical protein HWD61_06300 [Parachlamydiaceae bacterium]
MKIGKLKINPQPSSFNPTADPRKISLLDNAAIQELRPNQLPTLSLDDLRRIENPELLLSDEAIAYASSLSEHQNELLREHLRAHFHGDEIPLHYIGLISDSHVKELTEFTRIKYLPLDKVHLLKEEQLEEFEYGDYSKEFVEHLSDHGIKALNKPDLCALAEHLTDHHLKISMTNKITSLKNYLQHNSKESKTQHSKNQLDTSEKPL